MGGVNSINPAAGLDTGSQIDYNLQTVEGGGYDPRWEEGGCGPPSAYPSGSTIDYGPASTRHEYAL